MIMQKNKYYVGDIVKIRMLKLRQQTLKNGSKDRNLVYANKWVKILSFHEHFGGIVYVCGFKSKLTEKYNETYVDERSILDLNIASRLKLLKEKNEKSGNI